uniref:Uncharacterized protein n=1 Tax=Romanomermis culicivorax TaxID=13658 RepID=A0A915L8L4_ROMCU
MESLILLIQHQIYSHGSQLHFDFRYIICGNQCRTNELTSQCGEESNRVLIEFYRRIVSSLKQIAVEIYRWFNAVTKDVNSSKTRATKHFTSLIRFMSDRNLTRGDYCVQGCLKEKMIPREVREFFDDVARDVFRRQNSTNIRQIFNATMLDWYCG